MDEWKKELWGFALCLFFLMMIGALFIYFVISTFIGGDMKNLLIPTSLLIGLVGFKFWRSKRREKKEMENYLRDPSNKYNPPRKKLYRIKKAIDEVEIEMLLKKNDICIVESRNLSGEFETLVFFQDSKDFLVVIKRLNWDIRDPLKMILNSGDMSYKKTALRLTDILGNTVVAN